MFKFRFVIPFIIYSDIARQKSMWIYVLSSSLMSNLTNQTNGQDSKFHHLNPKKILERNGIIYLTVCGAVDLLFINPLYIVFCVFVQSKYVLQIS